MQYSIIIITIMIIISLIIIIIIITKEFIPTLAVANARLLNWLVRTGRYTVWKDKSPKATVTSFKFRLLDWRAGYLNWSLVRYRPL